VCVCVSCVSVCPMSEGGKWEGGKSGVTKQ